MLHPTESPPPTRTEVHNVEATHDIAFVFTIAPPTRTTDHNEATEDMEPTSNTSTFTVVEDHHVKNTGDMEHTSTVDPTKPNPRSWALSFATAPNYLTNMVPKFKDILSRTYRGLRPQEIPPFRDVSPEVYRFDEAIRQQLRREEMEVSEHQKVSENPKVGNLVRKEMQCESELEKGEGREEKRLKMSEVASLPARDLVVVKKEPVEDGSQLFKAPVMRLSAQRSASEAQKAKAFIGTVADPILLD